MPPALVASSLEQTSKSQRKSHSGGGLNSKGSSATSVGADERVRADSHDSRVQEAPARSSPRPRATHNVTSSSKHQGATTVPAASSEAAVQPHPGPPIPAACSHCAKLSPHGFSGTDPFKAQTCSVCDDRSELWVCLHCEKVFCGRFANRHGVIHWLNTKCEHSVLMSLSDGTIWCYLCREYQHHDASSVLSSFYAAFHMARHGEAPPVASLMRQNSLLSPDTLSGDELAMLSAFDAKQFRWNKWNSQSSSQSSENGGS